VWTAVGSHENGNVLRGSMDRPDGRHRNRANMNGGVTPRLQRTHQTCTHESRISNLLKRSEKPLHPHSTTAHAEALDRTTTPNGQFNLPAGGNRCGQGPAWYEVQHVNHTDFSRLDALNV
jgi:hypothetical protein